MVKINASVAFVLLITLCVLPLTVHSTSNDYLKEDSNTNKTKAHKLNVIAIFVILAAGAVGCSIPSLGRWFPVINPDKDYFVLIRSFAAGVILATGFVHILPDANEQLTSPCLPSFPWQNFPFSSFIAMLAAAGTLIVDTTATRYFSSRRQNMKETSAVHDLEPNVKAEQSHGADHVHTQTHGAAMLIDYRTSCDEDSQLMRNRVVANVLELGIIVHSVIIGISLGASETPSTIKPLIIALSFHQFFEGMGLGSAVAKAKFHLKAVVIMAIFFSLTTPAGIAIGIAISTSYNENSHIALILEGIFDSLAAGILIYMALVHLLAEDFMKLRLENCGRLLLCMSIFLFLGIGLMSLLAMWA